MLVSHLGRLQCPRRWISSSPMGLVCCITSNLRFPEFTAEFTLVLNSYRPSILRSMHFFSLLVEDPWLRKWLDHQGLVEWGFILDHLLPVEQEPDPVTEECPRLTSPLFYRPETSRSSARGALAPGTCRLVSQLRVLSSASVVSTLLNITARTCFLA